MATAATAPVPPARRTQNAEATRRALIRVAGQLFAADGYAKVSIDEICRRALVTKGALYHHFDDKRDLFRSVYADVERRWVDEIVSAASDEDDPLRFLHRGCAAFLDSCLDPAIQRIVLLDGPSVLGLEECRAVDNARGIGLIEQALENAVESGQLERQPVGPLAHLFLGAMNEASFAIARATDPAAARAEMGEGLARLIDGLQPSGGRRP
jgi:AcrR family transcriptional regulator